MTSRGRLVQSAGLLLLAAFAVSACNTAAANNNSPLANTEWVLSTIDGGPVASGMNSTLGFGLVQASGFSGCNSFSTSYQTSGNNGLAFGPIAATRMACETLLATFESKIYLNLARVAKYTQVGDTLTMYDRTNQEVLGYVKAAPQSVVGPWIVLSVNNGTGGVTSVPAGVGGAFSFLENGSVEGFGGCNNFSGSYTVDGESIAIGPLMSTMKACDEATNTFESQLMIALQNSTKWSVSAGKLDLRDDSGAQQVSAETAIK